MSGDSMKRDRRSISLALSLSIVLAGCMSEGAYSTVAMIDGARRGVGFYQWAQEGAPPEAAALAAPAAKPVPDPPAQPPQQAFLEGYRAYIKGEPARAIEKLKLAADKYPPLADYALFYLGSAERQLEDLPAAEQAFTRLVRSYSGSIFAQPAQLELARIALAQNDRARARQIAAQVIAAAPGAELWQGALLVMARSWAGPTDLRKSYDTLLEIRRDYPNGSADAQARSLEAALLAQHPEIVDRSSLEYQRREAELAVGEGDGAGALRHVRAALALGPPRPVKAELLWLEVRATASQPARQERAIHAYLKFAPRGAEGAAALDQLARIYRRRNDAAPALSSLQQLARNFPSSAQAPPAMVHIGRIMEEQGEMNKARAQYERTIARYPHSEAAQQARFRAPWMLYLSGSYTSAARRFKAMIGKAPGAGERDMFTYWYARALEKAGDHGNAQALFERLAASTESNYYPQLAARRVDVGRVVFPAAALSDPHAASPRAVPPAAQFHLERVNALNSLGLSKLVAAELMPLRAEAYRNHRLRDFVLAEFQAAGDYHNAIVTATQMAAGGALDRDLAERIRYPRAYWDLLAPAAERHGIDPYLLLALTRQESLFNPQARSRSDARGLMQLLPATAAGTARRQGIAAASLDLFDPVLNVRLGTAYLERLLDLFGGDLVRAVAAYNGGEQAVAQWNRQFRGPDDEWVENIGYAETRDYVKKVLGGMREYRLLYAQHASS